VARLEEVYLEILKPLELIIFEGQTINFYDVFRRKIVSGKLVKHGDRLGVYLKIETAELDQPRIFYWAQPIESIEQIPTVWNASDIVMGFADAAYIIAPKGVRFVPGSCPQIERLIGRLRAYDDLARLLQEKDVRFHISTNLLSIIKGDGYNYIKFNVTNIVGKFRINFTENWRILFDESLLADENTMYTVALYELIEGNLGDYIVRQKQFYEEDPLWEALHDSQYLNWRTTLEELRHFQRLGYPESWKARLAFDFFIFLLQANNFDANNGLVLKSLEGTFFGEEFEFYTRLLYGYDSIRGFTNKFYIIIQKHSASITKDLGKTIDGNLLLEIDSNRALAVMNEIEKKQFISWAEELIKIYEHLRLYDQSYGPKSLTDFRCRAFLTDIEMRAIERELLPLGTMKLTLEEIVAVILEAMESIDSSSSPITIGLQPLTLEQFLNIWGISLSVAEKGFPVGLQTCSSPINLPIRYRDLAGIFDENLTCELNLRVKGDSRVTGIGKDSQGMAKMLEMSLRTLESIIADTELKAYYQELIKHPNNRAPPIKIKVSSKLPIESARYYNPAIKESEIIFNEDFIGNLISIYADNPAQTGLILAVRLFHVLGLTNYISFYSYLRKEYELIKHDLKFYQACRTQGVITDDLYPPRYNKLLEDLINNPGLITDFDTVIMVVNRLEEEAKIVYKQKDLLDYGDPLVKEARVKRIGESFNYTDPEAGGSLIAKLKKNPIFAGTFLNIYLTVLGHRGTACGRESSYFLAKDDNGAIIIPFDQLKSFQIPAKLDKNRAVRQQFALHYGLYMVDGLATTEAENGRGLQQGFHDHPFVEMTISLSNNTLLRYAHHLLSEDQKTIQFPDRLNSEGMTYEEIVGGVDNGKEVIEFKSNPGKKFVIYDKPVLFGNIIKMPRKTYHTIKNNSLLAPSVDFTNKECVTQMIKTFVPDTDPQVEGLQVIPGTVVKYPSWGEIRTHDYGDYNTCLLRDTKSGEMAYTINKEGIPEPVMYGKLHLNIHIGTIKHQSESSEFEFKPVFGNMQPVRIFPWPAELPADDAEEPSVDPSLHKWAFYRDRPKLKAEFTVIYSDGSSKSFTNIIGGDLILLDNSYCDHKKIKSFKIRNIAEETNFELMFFTLENLEARNDPIPSNTTLDMDDVVMGFGAVVVAQSSSTIVNDVKTVAYIAPEAKPFFFTGGLGDVGGELPMALSDNGLNVYIFTYKYDAIDPSLLEDTGVTCVTKVEYYTLPTKIWTAKRGKVTYYFLEIADLFKEAYAGDRVNFANGLAEGTFRAIEALVYAGKMLNPQILHANDWPASLVPLFLNVKYNRHPLFKDTASVFTIHNPRHIADWIPGYRFPELGVGGEHWFSMVQPNSPEHFCLMRGAVYHADKFNAVSKNNRNEMLTPEGGIILYQDYRARVADFLGINNGVYYPVWEPVSLDEKPALKAAMQEKSGLRRDKNIPLFGMVARIAEQKGVRQVVRVIDWVLRETNAGIQFIYLGKGNAQDTYAWEVGRELEQLQQRWPNNVRFMPKYTTADQKDVFHSIDIFTYPSGFEPFGTKPIVALINGAPGVVRRTGGLADNFHEYEWFTGKGNGWVFENINDDELHSAIWRANNTFHDSYHWDKVTRNAKGQDWSWDGGPVNEYINMYGWAREKKISISSPIEVTYGKDVMVIASYFGGDIEKTKKALLNWQGEYKEILGKDKSLFDLTTFKDEEHKYGTEYFLVTDENGNYLYDGSGNHIIRPRDLCHMDGTWHRSVFVFLVDHKGNVLIQIRSASKQYWPLAKDISVGGHHGLDIEPILSAQREVNEEIFNDEYKIDPARLFQMNRDDSLSHICSNKARPADNERVTVYIYLTEDAEKELVK
ncbi:glycosyltransferase, partial [bacterium]